MIATAFADLPISPFARLRALLSDIEPAKTEISLALGEPRHPPPAMVISALAQEHMAYGKYPPIAGTDALRHAIHGWLGRRFSLPSDFIDPATQILPVNGTREALFLAAQLAPQKSPAYCMMPNPFYQVYAAAALAARQTPYYLSASAGQGFLPELGSVTETEWQNCSVFYLCSPANPQGVIAGRDYLTILLHYAQKYEFLLLVDECYCEIYDKSPPPSILEIMQSENMSDAPVLAFHSLSKRSNLPGLRSGFVAGGKTIMQRFFDLRMIAAPQNPLPAQYAASLAWQDDAHVIENRSLYQKKFALAEEILAGSFCFTRPAGGFFLWLKTKDDERAALKLYRQEGIRVLPGSYLARPDRQGVNPAHGYLRLALVGEIEETRNALMRLRDCLQDDEEQA